jgi:hypothetical protein
LNASSSNGSAAIVGTPEPSSFRIGAACLTAILALGAIRALRTNRYKE